MRLSSPLDTCCTVLPPASLQRPRPEDEDSDDDVSIVSRTPSPSPEPEAMDIDKYDEYVKKPSRETITVDTKIKSSNKGFLMLASMGWVEGQPLGLSGDGAYQEQHDCVTHR